MVDIVQACYTPEAIDAPECISEQYADDSEYEVCVTSESQSGLGSNPETTQQAQCPGIASHIIFR